MGTSRWIAGVVLFSSLNVIGQTVLLQPDTIVDLNPWWSNSIRIQGSADYNSNTVFNELPLGIYRGGDLSRSIREPSLNALDGDQNTAGYFAEGRLTWAGSLCSPERSKWRPLISIAHHELGGLRFTKDQFAITFFGNAAYENKTAELAPSGFEQIRYQTIGFGAQHRNNGSMVRVDLVRGNAFSSVDVQNATLFTATDGRELRTDVAGEYYASDTAGGSWDRSNGIGAALTGQWNTSFTLWTRKLRFGVGVEDLGFVAWNDRSVSITKDTLVTYEGWQVDNIFALDEVIIGKDVVLDTLGLRYKRGSVTRLLPFRAHLMLGMDLGNTGHLALTVDQRYIVGYIPQISLMASRRFGQRTQLGAVVSYGGFGALRVGLAAKHRIGKHVLLQISTPHVPGFFMARTCGIGLSFGAEFAF